MSITYDTNAPRFPDLSKYRLITDEPTFRAAKPVALGFRVHSDLSGADPTWQKNESIASSMGIVRLGYDYEDNGSALDFLALFPPKPGRIPVLDAEYKGLTLSEAEAWATTVQKAYGRPAVIYGHSLLMSWHPTTGSILRKMPSWQATYGMSLNPVPWALDPFLWQYSDGSTKWPSPGPRAFPGVGPCDMNTLRISVAFLRTMAGLDSQGGDAVLTDEDAQQLGYAKVGDWKTQEDRAKAVSDVLGGRAKRTGQSQQYEDQYDATAKAVAGGGGGLPDHKHEPGGVQP